MAINIPSTDRITHDNPKLGEALLKIQQYINTNVTQVTGNKIARPPIDSTRSFG